MKKIFLKLSCCLSFMLGAQDQNLMIVVDNLSQETAKTQEINMTHQVMTVLQQRASAVLVSTSLWKNIIDRKKKFAINLHNPDSLQSAMVAMYQKTNQELQQAAYNLNRVNEKLSHVWFADQYPMLANLSEQECNLLRFDFGCYLFDFDVHRWNIYSAHTGMLLFVPTELDYQVNSKFELLDARDFVKHADKKSNVIESLEKLLPEQKNSWVIYLTGHGHPQSSHQGANIAGLKIDEFSQLLQFFNDGMQLKLLVYSSCYGGGVHTLEPYGTTQFNYPIMVTAATDAPIFGFGIFEGVKLPPYDAQFSLQSTDIDKKNGLVPSALQNFSAFFKRAWKNQFDLILVQSISRFFSCNVIACHVQKIENFPLIRKAGSSIFAPIRDTVINRLVQIITGQSFSASHKPILLYTHHVKKIKLTQSVPIISMLPGLQSHAIDHLIARNIAFSDLILQSFLSLQDMQPNKNFMIKNLNCINDLVGSSRLPVTLTNVEIIGQHELFPDFLAQQADVLVYFSADNKKYLSIVKDQKIVDTQMLHPEQIDDMQQILGFIEQMSDHDALVAPDQLVTFDAYRVNQEFQQSVTADCIKKRVCKKSI